MSPANEVSAVSAVKTCYWVLMTVRRIDDYSKLIDCSLLACQASFYSDEYHILGVYTSKEKMIRKINKYEDDFPSDDSSSNLYFVEPFNLDDGELIDGYNEGNAQEVKDWLYSLCWLV